MAEFLQNFSRVRGASPTLLFPLCHNPIPQTSHVCAHTLPCVLLCVFCEQVSLRKLHPQSTINGVVMPVWACLWGSLRAQYTKYKRTLSSHRNRHRHRNRHTRRLTCGARTHERTQKHRNRNTNNKGYHWFRVEYNAVSAWHLLFLFYNTSFAIVHLGGTLRGRCMSHFCKYCQCVRSCKNPSKLHGFENNLTQPDILYTKQAMKFAVGGDYSSTNNTSTYVLMNAIY